MTITKKDYINLIEQKAIIDKPDEGGNTPLMAAVFKGNAKSTEILIANGADVNFKNNEEYTPLVVAIKFNIKGSDDEYGIINRF